MDDPHRHWGKATTSYTKQAEKTVIQHRTLELRCPGTGRVTMWVIHTPTGRLGYDRRPRFIAGIADLSAISGCSAIRIILFKKFIKHTLCVTYKRTNHRPFFSTQLITV